MKPTLEAVSSDTSFFGHPRGLATLFFTEMWERFSYYGMRALLILFMTASVSKGGTKALSSVVKAGCDCHGSCYTAMVYLLKAGQGLGGRSHFRIAASSTGYGGILIVAGQLFLMSPGVEGFYAGLGLLMLGTGMLKPNASTIRCPSSFTRRAVIGVEIPASGAHYHMGINLYGLPRSRWRADG